MEKGEELTEQQKQYLQNIVELQAIKIIPGVYRMKSDTSIEVEVLAVNEEENWCVIRNVKSGFQRLRTLHWCKKRLVDADW